MRRESGFAVHKEISQNLAFPFDSNHTARLEIVIGFQQSMRLGSDENAARRGVTLHAAGQVDGVSPEVVSEFLRADNASHDRATIKTDAHPAGMRVAQLESC